MSPPPESALQSAYITISRPAGSSSPNAILQLPHDPTQSARNELKDHPRKSPTYLFYLPSDIPVRKSNSKDQVFPFFHHQLRLQPLTKHSPRHKTAIYREGIEDSHNDEDDLRDEPYFTTSRCSFKQSNHTCNEVEDLLDEEARSVNLATVSLFLPRWVLAEPRSAPEPLKRRPQQEKE
ncbi:hypothetical protein XANCAGTX0491_002423 [Xanthoria calcicola]